MTINHHHLNKKKQHDLDFHPRNRPGSVFSWPPPVPLVSMELHMLSPTSQCSWPTRQRCWPLSPGDLNSMAVLSKRMKKERSANRSVTCLVSFGPIESLWCDIYRKSEICVLLLLFRAFFSWSCGLFWEPFFLAESNYGNPKSEGSTRLVDSYDLCFFPFATSPPFREETRGKSSGLHQVGSIRYQASGSVIAIRPYGKISRSQPGNWKKGSNLSFTQLFLIFGVRLIEVSYICIVAFIFFWSFCCSNSVDIPKRITSFFMVCPNMIWQTVEVSYIWVSRVSVTFPL